MAMRHRPTERKAVVALLEQEWEDTGDLAEAILDTLLDLKWARGGFIVVARHAGSTPFYQAVGPYDTVNQATKDIGKRIITYTEGGRAMVLKVENLDGKKEEATEGLW